MKWRLLFVLPVIFILASCNNRAYINEAYGYKLYQNEFDDCATAEEKIKEDSEFYYYFPCIESEHYIAIDEDGNEYSIQELLILDLLTIEEVYDLFDGHLHKMEVENPVDLPVPEPVLVEYCFYSDRDYDYCVDDKSTYDRLFFVIDGKEYPLLDAVEIEQEIVLMHDDVIRYEKTYDVVHEGTATLVYPYIQEPNEYTVSYKLLKYEDERIDTDGVRSITGPNGYCMIDDLTFHQYAIEVESVRYDYNTKEFITGEYTYTRQIKRIDYYLTHEEIQTYLGITCTEEIESINNLDHHVSYKDDDITVVYLTLLINGDTPAFSSYTDEGIDYCTQVHSGNRHEYVIKEGVTYTVLQALEAGIIEGKDLYKYALPSCTSGRSSVESIYDWCDLSSAECDEMFYKEHETINGLDVYRSTHVSLYTEDSALTYTHNLKNYLVFDYIMQGYYYIEDINGTTYTFEEALDAELIDFDDLLAFSHFTHIEYKYVIVAEVQ